MHAVLIEQKGREEATVTDVTRCLLLTATKVVVFKVGVVFVRSWCGRDWGWWWWCRSHTGAQVPGFGACGVGKRDIGGVDLATGASEDI